MPELLLVVGIGVWSKDVGLMIRYFYETFKNQPKFSVFGNQSIAYGTSRETYERQWDTRISLESFDLESYKLVCTMWCGLAKTWSLGRVKWNRSSRKKHPIYLRSYGSTVVKWFSPWLMPGGSRPCQSLCSDFASMDSQIMNNCIWSMIKLAESKKNS